jgi:hypothetical protein
VLAQIDADDPSSFDAKDRYDVGGYPTMLVLRPGRHGDRSDGRVLGGSGRRRLVAARRHAIPLGDLPPPDSLSPDDAAELAVRIALSLDGDAAKPYLARAKESDSTAFHLARFLIEPTAEDGRILAERDAPGWDWVFAGLETAKATPGARRDAARRRETPTRGRARPRSTRANPSRCWQSSRARRRRRICSWPRHRFSSRGSPASRIAIAATTGSSPISTSRAAPPIALERSSSTPSRATPRSSRSTSKLAQHLLDRGLASEALPSAQAAYDHSYGDNRLRAAKTLAVALHEIGRDADAVAVVDRALAEAHRPAEDQKVRTFRYLDALVATRADITKASSPK